VRKPLNDARLSRPEFRNALKRMAAESGWAEVGGILIRDTDGNPVDRTRWIPRAEWYQRMQATPEARIPGGQWAVARAVALAVKGEPMNPQQRRTVAWMLNDHESYAAWREEEARAAAEQIAA
jgi:hypothetical protein